MWDEHILNIFVHKAVGPPPQGFVSLLRLVHVVAFVQVPDTHNQLKWNQFWIIGPHLQDVCTNLCFNRAYAYLTHKSVTHQYVSTSICAYCEKKSENLHTPFLRTNNEGSHLGTLNQDAHWPGCVKWMHFFGEIGARFIHILKWHRHKQSFGMNLNSLTFTWRCQENWPLRTCCQSGGDFCIYAQLVQRVRTFLCIC